MKVWSLIQRNVISCTIHDDLQGAARLVWDRDVGCLPVIDAQGHVMGLIDDQGHPVGILSINDIARAASGGQVSA